jgi:phenylalanyl-tRNA synthetase beta chain
MKFSLSGANNLSHLDFNSLEHSEVVKKMGLQLGAIENTVDYAKRYEDILVVKIISSEKHPDADKLRICKIDDGGFVQNINRDENGFVQVVCGAPNASKDKFVVWIPPGAIVPSTLDNEPFVLESREIRGQISNGMLASPKELGLNDDHEVILELTEDSAETESKAGEYFSKYFGLDDFIVDCENKMFTHRPDCFGNIGIARELAGIFGLKFESPDWYKLDPKFENISEIELDVRNEINEVVPRFMVVAMGELEIKDSPLWMQSYLQRVGMKPINNVVDITNFVMHVTGQPLHAFDYDKLLKCSNSPSIMPRYAKKGEKLSLLGGKEILLDEKDLVISTDKKAVALAGVMGGAETEVDSNTKSILLECANFDMYSVRRSSMRHGVFTEAVSRFNKGQSPLQNDRVVTFAMNYLARYSGAVQKSKVYDLVSFDLAADNLNHVTLSIDNINKKLGTNLQTEEVKVLLQNVEFNVLLRGGDLEITVPFWRMDIAIAEDIVEEVGRLYGYDKIAAVLPKRSSIPPKVNETREFKNFLRNRLAKHGANEILSYSFVNGDLMKSAGIDPEKWSYHLRNALSPELQYYRSALLPSLLARVRANLKARAGSEDNQFALFEIGKVHIKNEMEEDDSSLPKQFRRLAFVVVADKKTSEKHFGSAYYLAKKYLDMLTNIKAEYAKLDEFDAPFSSAFQKGRSAYVSLGNNRIGVIGEFNSKTTSSLKLPEYCAGFELDLDLFRTNYLQNEYSKLSDFPSTSQDITFEVDISTNWGDIFDLVDAEIAVAGAEDNFLHELKPLSIYSPDKSDKKRISFRISITHQQKTLRTEELSSLLNKVAEALHEKYKAIRI